MIAGGSLENGTASDAVLTFDPATQRDPPDRPAARADDARSRGRRSATSVYVIGGRSATSDTPTARIVAVDLATRTSPRGRARCDGRAPTSRPRRLGDADPRRGRPCVQRDGRDRQRARADPCRRASRRARAAHRSREPANVYAADGAGMLSRRARQAKPLVYVPNSDSDTVDVIDPHTFRSSTTSRSAGCRSTSCRRGTCGRCTSRTTPATALTPIDPRTGKPGRADPGRRPLQHVLHARRPLRDRRRRAAPPARLPRRAHVRGCATSLSVPCVGVDHMDFSADGRYLLASCEFSGQLVKVDVAPAARRSGR